jgi:hypothetical protein
VAQKLIGGMPREIDMGGGWQVAFAAVDPDTGAAVAGVKISHAVLDVETDATPSELDQLTDAGPFMLVPGPAA